MNRSIKPYQTLAALCQNPEIKSNAKEVNEILGFICVVAASPEPLDLQDWFPCLWRQGGEPSFSSEALAVDFASAILQFYEACMANYQQAAPLILPTDCWLDDSLQVTEQGCAFASGCMSAFQHSEASWQPLHSQPDSEQLLQTSILLLSKMATPDTSAVQMQELFAQLPGMPEIVGSLPQLLSALGNSAARVATHE